MIRLPSLVQPYCSCGAAAASKVTEGGALKISAGDLRKQIEALLTATGKPELQPTAITKEEDKVTTQAKDKVSDSVIGKIQEKLPKKSSWQT